MGRDRNEATHDTYRTACGPIPYNMTNDYMFRVILQKNESVLRGLIGSLLHLDQSVIDTVVITNPIKFGEQIDSKTFILDIHLRLNDNTNVNLEMQVINRGDWTDRSLCYLCRTYDQLYQGDAYSDTNCAIHIGILDFTLFREIPEFYASYKLMNEKNHHIYSDKFQLRVLELNQVELATEEDQKYQIDRWAKLFKATTWEDLRMIAEKDEYMSEAAAEMYKMNEDEIIREQCLAREEYYRYEKRTQKRLQRLDEIERELEEKVHALEEKDRVLAEQKDQLDTYKKRIEYLELQLSKKV